MMIKRSAFVFSAVLATGAVFAQDEAAEGAKEEQPKVAATTTARAAFTTLPLCRLVEGTVEVRKPAGEWMQAEEGLFYPLGCSYRTMKGGRLVLAFGKDSEVEIGGNAEFATRQQELGVASRTVSLVAGTVDIRLASNLPEGAFFVAAPGFIAKNLAGDSRYTYLSMGDGDKVTVRCVTGTLALEGRHFVVPAMHAADEVVIRTSHDDLTTIMYGTSGDYAVILDQGLGLSDEIADDGSIKKVVSSNRKEWRLSPSTKIVINRSVPAIGERMSVHTMAFDAAGALKTECCFCEGRAEVNFGELVAKDKTDGEELAKRAAEATETTAAADAEEASADKKENNNNENSNQE